MFLSLRIHPIPLGTFCNLKAVSCRFYNNRCYHHDTLKKDMEWAICSMNRIVYILLPGFLKPEEPTSTFFLILISYVCFTFSFIWFYGVFSQAVKKMKKRQNRVPVYHLRAGISHCLLNLVSHMFIITVSRTLGAGCFSFLVRAFYKTGIRISLKLFAVGAK